MPVTYPYIQYGGIWTTSQATDAVAAGTWAVPPQPHLFGWGVNAQGQLGLDNTTNYSSPKQLGSLTNWSVLLSAGTRSFAIKTDGTLWAWGSNQYGVLGLGNKTNYSSPKQVGSLTNWLYVSASTYGHAVAIRTDNTLWSWGKNNQGQLGLGNTTYYSSPKQVGSLANWLNVSTGNSVTFAVKTDGTIWSWGYNAVGVLGLNNTTNYSSPKQIGSLSNWYKISSSALSVLALKTNGTLWSWGSNSYGQLGLPASGVYYSSPVQVGALTNWSVVSSSQTSSYATKSDGTLWSWGRGYAGSLGLGNTTDYSSPKQIGSLTTWLSVASGYLCGFAIKTDGTLWSWGQNNVGQLGQESRTYFSSPKQVGTLTSWTTVSANTNEVLAIAKT